MFLQNMNKLQTSNNVVFQKIMTGCHVIRRTSQHWAGLGSDLVIEQTMMRSLKSTVGLTRGSGITEHQRATWTMSAPISSAYDYAMQNFNKTSEQHKVTSEQHKEPTPSRMERDIKDFETLTAKLKQHSPFSDEKAMRNIITG